MNSKKTEQSIEKKMISRVYGHGRGWCFSRTDFSSLGSIHSIDFGIHRMLRKGVVRRISRGLYDYPKFSKMLNKPLGPDMDQAARALARKFGWDIQPSHATAQNFLGLSNQVPGHFEYLTNGPSREYKIGKFIVSFRKTSLKELRFKFHESALIVQALKGYGGQENVPDGAIEKIRSWLPVELRPLVLNDTARVTGWVYEMIRHICRESD